MRHLIIKALHRNESFLAEVTEKLTSELTYSGSKVNIRDLYAENFQPVLSRDDFTALKNNRLPEDILREQEYIQNADLLWVIFPIWWTSMPAILKGYIDRIFLSGFAYRMKSDRLEGLLTNKKVIILNSMGMSREEYANTGMYEALRMTIDKGIFEFTGMQVIDHRYFTSIMSATDKQRKAYLDEVTELARQYAGNNDFCRDVSKQFVA